MFFLNACTILRFSIGTVIYTTDHSDVLEAKSNQNYESMWGPNPKGAYDNTAKVLSSPLFIGVRDNLGTIYRYSIDAPTFQDLFQNGMHVWFNIPKLWGSDAAMSPYFVTPYENTPSGYSYFGTASYKFY